MLGIDQLEYRRLDPVSDAQIALAHHAAACVASYGLHASPIDRRQYLKWLRDRVEEFPDGHVLVWRAGECVGQLDLQAPYGLPTGYINLYFVREEFRGHGVGTQMHQYVERYFRSWEVARVELHVSMRNDGAQRFYRRLGYKPMRREGPMYRMALELT